MVKIENSNPNIQGKASILAIGTELTTGQITNRNAAWISDKLANCGIEVVLHQTVADDRTRIREALNYCASQSQLIFVTGGLGPTTDDFTRDVIAAWLNQPLEFDEDSWQRIIQRLTGFGVPVAQSNRQQCYFPKGSKIIPNPDGTASGFTSEISGLEIPRRIFVLPGPPNEVSAIWKQGIEAMIRDLCPDVQPLELYTWQCMGKSEAELGEITERALEGSGLLTGYRAHRPFVEVKVWCPSSQVHVKQNWIQKLTEVLSPWTLTRQGENLAERLLKHLYRSEAVEIIDAASAGILAERLGALLRDPKYQEQSKSFSQAIALITEWNEVPSPESWVAEALQQSDDTSLTLVIGGFTSDGAATVGLREGNHHFQETIVSPYKSPELLIRTRYYVLEMALKKWCDWLERSVQ
jgi:molybdenum cofactor synthesis domain-containing protein